MRWEPEFDQSLKEARSDVKTVKVKTLSVNQQFMCYGQRWVAIPRMGLDCSGWSFVINALRIVESEDMHIPPKFIAEYIHEETLVQVVEE